MKSFKGKVAAITGAGSGIGRGLAEKLASEGCNLALSDIDERGLAETAESLASRGTKVTRAKVDVGSKEAVYRWADDVVRDHGACHLIFNNAGVSFGSTVEGAEYEDFERLMNINFWGVVYGTKAFLPHLRASGEGHVVNISSLFGLISVPGQCAYNASKFAVRGFTECLREELDLMKAPVSATCVHPGGIRTNIARASKTHESVRQLGVDPAEASTRFEKMFRLSAEDAAAIILRGVRNNERRVLVGVDAKVLEAVQRLIPSSYQRIVLAAARQSFKVQRKGSS